MRTIEKRVTKTILEMEKTVGKSNRIKEYERANSNFKKLVSEGFVKERGNHLLSPAELPVKVRVVFNS